jgi:DNA-binding LacI/PurR family transcriptional regulator
MFFSGSFDQDNGRAGCQHFLSMEHRPTALICASDNIAFGALYYAKEQGLDCPKDLSIMGFDDGPLGGFFLAQTHHGAPASGAVDGSSGEYPYAVYSR